MGADLPAVVIFRRMANWLEKVAVQDIMRIAVRLTAPPRIMHGYCVTMRHIHAHISVHNWGAPYNCCVTEGRICLVQRSCVMTYAVAGRSYIPTIS